MTYWYLAFSFQTTSGALVRKSRTVSVDSPELPLLAVQKALLLSECQDFAKGTFIYDHVLKLSEWQFKELETPAP